jgi:hypothetical protein
MYSPTPLPSFDFSSGANYSGFTYQPAPYMSYTNMPYTMPPPPPPNMQGWAGGDFYSYAPSMQNFSLSPQQYAYSSFDNNFGNSSFGNNFGATNAYSDPFNSWPRYGGHRPLKVILKTPTKSKLDDTPKMTF